jgi:hypothetical protein
VQVELQLEDKQVREQVRYLLSDLSDLCALLDETKLVKEDARVDTGFPHIRSCDEPLMNPVYALVPVLTDLTETLHRRLAVWTSLKDHPRMTPKRLDRVRNYLNSKSSSYHRVRAPHYTNKDVPLILSPMSWAQIVKSFGPETAQRLTGASSLLRLELASERHLRKQHPERAEKQIQEWWDRRHSPPRAIEDVAHRRDRLRRLLDKYGIRPKVIELDKLPVPQNPFGITPDKPDSLPPPLEVPSKLFNEIMNAPIQPHERRVKGQSYPLKFSDLSNDPEMRLVPLKPFDVPNRPIKPSPRYVPIFEPDHEDIQKVMNQLAGLENRLLCLKGFGDIARAKPVAPAANPAPASADLPSNPQDPLPPPTPAPQNLEPDKLPPLPRVDDLPPHPAPPPAPVPSQWPSAGESISLRGNELRLLRTSKGELLLRWEPSVSPGCKKHPGEATVIEIALDHALSSRVDFSRFAEQLCAELDGAGALGETNPLSSDFFISLSSHGRLKTLQNVMLTCTGDAAIYNLDLAPGAELKAVASDNMGVVLRLRGTNAAFSETDFLGTTLDLQLAQSTWQNCHFSRKATLRGSFGSGSFDADCTIQANAADADFRGMEILGDDVQKRLAGLLYRSKLMNTDALARLKVRHLSNEEWAAEQRKRDEDFTAKRLVSAVQLLEPASHYRPPRQSFAYTPQATSAPEAARERVALKVAPLELLKLYIAPPADKTPCQLRFELYAREADTQAARLVRQEPVQREETAHYHGALFYTLDLVFERAKRLPPRGPAKRRLPWLFSDDALQPDLSGVEEVVSN